MTSRVGSDKLDAMNMLLTLLPGVSTTYYGDEIGMEDIDITNRESQDPVGKVDKVGRGLSHLISWSSIFSHGGYTLLEAKLNYLHSFTNSILFHGTFIDGEGHNLPLNFFWVKLGNLHKEFLRAAIKKLSFSPIILYLKWSYQSLVTSICLVCSYPEKFHLTINQLTCTIKPFHFNFRVRVVIRSVLLCSGLLM